MSTNIQAERLCEQVVKSKDMSNATVRIAAWLLGAANASGGFPLDLSYRQVRDGYNKEGVYIAGTGSRIETIKASFEWLEDRGYLTTEKGNASGFGHTTRLYRLTL